MRSCRSRPEQASPETDNAMHKPANSRWRQVFWFVVFTSFLFSVVLFFYSYDSSNLVKKTGNQNAHSLANQATIATHHPQIDHDHDHDRDDDDQAPPIDKLLAEDGMLEDSQRRKEKGSVSVTVEVKKPKSDYKTTVSHSAFDQDSGGVIEEAEKPIVEKEKATVEDNEEKAEKMPTDHGDSVSNGAAGNVEEEPIKNLSVEEKKIDADKLPDGTVNPEFMKGSVEGVGDRGNAKEENKIDAGETLADKLPVGDENKKQGVVQDAGSIRKNAEKMDKLVPVKNVADKLPVDGKNKKQGFVQDAEKVDIIDAMKRVADKLPVDDKDRKQGYVLDAGNIKGNAEKVDKLVPVKNVVDKLPVDGKSAPSKDTVKAARGKQSKEGNNDVPTKVSENKLKPTQQIPKEEGAGVRKGRRRGSNGGQDGVNAKQPKTVEFSDSCRGRYIYIHELPGRFNEDMIRNCYSLSKWVDMCQYIANFGLGPQLDSSRKEFSHGGWFATNQFTLEVIFHNRMKQYKCLTKDSSKASAIYVPYYAGLDVSRYLWYDKELKDSAAIDLVRWLQDQPEWKRMWGRDHFFVAGRITWDFRREGDNLRNWGNKLMFLPEAKNMTILTIESSPWHSNDFGIPYPTYFHPKSDYQIRQWQRKVKKMRRKYLFCFAGAPRPNLRNSIRGEIISQCQAARSKCRLLECLKGNKCYQPVYVMNMFESSTFCLQPSGDSFTRRSTFDAILAGCIPVFFHPASAYVQYIWHFTKDYHKYSVWIQGKDVKEGKVNIEAVLSDIPKEKVVAMREELIRLIPKITYADPGSQLETTEDAFDIAVNGVLERVERIRREMGEGKNTSFSFDEEKAWKFYTFGILGEHEWDGLFDRRRSSLMN